MQSSSSRIWTRVAVFISYGDNDYTTGTFPGIYYFDDFSATKFYFQDVCLFIFHSFQFAR